MEKIVWDIAKKEVYNWLDFKKISDRKREKNADNIETLIDAVCEGIISIDDKTFVITHELKFAKGENEQIKSLEYNPRTDVKSIQMQMQGVKATDLHGMIVAYTCALTAKPKGVIAALDTEDYAIASGIVVFFM